MDDDKLSDLILNMHVRFRTLIYGYTREVCLASLFNSIIISYVVWQITTLSKLQL